MSQASTYSYDCRVGEQIGETDDEQPVVAGKGDGSLTSGEALKDQDRPKNRHAAQGQQRTTFHADQAKDSAKYSRLWKHQHGYYNDDTGKRSNADKVKLAESLCDSLHLSTRLKDDVKRLVQQLDGRGFNRFGGLEALALGSILVAQNRTIERPEEYEDRIQVRDIMDHNGERVYNHDLPRFKHLAEKYSVDWRKAATKVKELTSE
ncbi:hypothetical protein [Natrinema versiforme]|uniref:Uncharacterized protein n=1 Tax=Natrinema versiforme TaxID=88724 RepID=A0A4P8WM04_9EURY|nr:hypothetical protein [Natrinema versiforme]QCS43011.1 hypothetical protein FEJ81_11820 [Natrinema versiforme]